LKHRIILIGSTGPQFEASSQRSDCVGIGRHRRRLIAARIKATELNSKL